MGLGEIISKSFGEYKANAGAYSLAVFLIYGIPVILFNLLVGYYYGFDMTGLSSRLGEVANLSELWIIISPLAVILSAYILVYSLLYIILYRGIIDISRKKKFSFGEVFSLGTKKYGKTLGFYVVYFLFLVGLFLMLIIPGIIFSIYWALAIYVLIYEDKNIIDSLKVSFNLVRKRWWMTLAYVIVFSLITWIISFVISIPSSSLALYTGFKQALSGDISSNLILISKIISVITQIISNCIIIPLTILFGKNLYLEYKRKKA
jgi:hypothetical protein